MNPHILTELEKKQTLKYFEDKNSSPAIRNIRSRSNKNYTRLIEDLYLVSSLLGDKTLAAALFAKLYQRESTKEPKLHMDDDEGWEALI